MKGLALLAYVFWHWKRSGVAAGKYEDRQRAFYAALASAPSAGFLRSFSAGISGAPWALDGGVAYEDWYLIQDFAALGELNQAAVSASRAAPHAAAAALAGGGAGGLYSLRLGAALPSPSFAHWFGKPAGMHYEEIFAHLAPLVEKSGGALWMRQLVLGPAREFCLHAVESVALPAAFGALVIPLRSVSSELAQ
jgi:hypothetical protein